MRGAVITVSRYGQDYLREHGNIDAVIHRFPAYGDGPFPFLGRPDLGAVTLVNAAVEKGFDLFIDLAEAFPGQEFAVVGWLAPVAALDTARKLPNVRLLDPVDDIDELLKLTKIALMPSRFPETFGLFAVEAMLRGIPVLASDQGGLSEAKLGVDYLLPVEPRPFHGGPLIMPPRDAGPWRECSAGCSVIPWSTTVVPKNHETRPPDSCRRLTSRRSRTSSDRSALPGRGAAVAVVDPFDAAFMLAEELQRRGHPCIGVESSDQIDLGIVAKCRPDRLQSYIRHRGDLGATAAELRGLGVRSVMPGCETGVTLADWLAESLDVCGNGTSLFAGAARQVSDGGGGAPGRAARSPATPLRRLDRFTRLGPPAGKLARRDKAPAQSRF